MDLQAGGPTQSIKNQISYLSDFSNFNFSLYTLNSKNRINENSFTESVNFKYYDNTITLLCNFLKSDFRLVHIHGIWEFPNHMLSLLSRLRQIPYIISPRGMLESWSLNQSKLSKSLALNIYQLSDLKKAKCLHATSFMEADSIRRLGIKNQIEIIPNGINLTSFSSEKPNSKENVIIFVSRIHPKKGLENLIAAVDKLGIEKLKDWKIEIYGSGEEVYVQQLKSLVIEKKLNNLIKFNSFISGNDKINKLRNSRILILPSYSENFGNIIAEALASFTPVITTKNTPWTDLSTFSCGWHVNNEINDLANAISEAIGVSENDYEIMSINARKLVESKYDSKIIAYQIDQLYHHLI